MNSDGSFRTHVFSWAEFISFKQYTKMKLLKALKWVFKKLFIKKCCQ